MTEKSSPVPSPENMTEVYEAYLVDAGDTVYLTCDKDGKPCDPVPVVVTRHSTSGQKLFVPCPENPQYSLTLDDFGLAYRGVMMVR